MDVIDFDNIKLTIIGGVIILNITLNGNVVAVIVKYPKLREGRTTLFIPSISLADLSKGCRVIPISIALCSEA